MAVAAAAAAAAVQVLPMRYVVSCDNMFMQ